MSATATALLITSTAPVVAAAGTSFAAPYVSGIVALWLQHKQTQAAALGVSLDADAMNHEAAMKGLVSTARGVPDRENAKYLESVALMGAGGLGS
mgnify:CR=1 FL=1